MSFFTDYLPTRDASRQMVLMAAVLAAVFMAKLVALIVWGPGMQPDSGGYIAYAARLMNDRQWMTDAELESAMMPVTVFRVIGYPALIAVMQLLSAQFWDWFLILLQMTLSIITLGVCFVLAIRLGLGKGFAVFAVLASGLSLSFTLDQFILTDSLFASLFILVISTLALGALACRPLGLGEALALGVLLSLALLLREGAGILSVLFLLLLGCRIFLSPQGQRLKSCIGAVSVFVPLFLTSQIYQGWNENRTGDRFITTGGQTVYLQGLVDAARRDTLIFSGDTDMDLAARDILADYSFAEVLQILSRLYDEGYQAPALAAMSRGKYMQAWVERPSSMLRMTVGHMRESLAFMTFQPLAAIRDTGFWATGERPWPDYSGLKRNLSDGTGTIILFGFESLERVTGILLTLSFLLTPAVWLVRAFRRRDWNTLLSGPVLVPVALWLFYLGFMIAHAMVHLETRYMAPVLPFSIMIGLLGIQGIYIAVRQRIRGRNAS